VLGGDKQGPSFSSSGESARRASAELYSDDDEK
jgi:hypothetical protein